ncbi:MAG: phosphate ABC transporter permease PstA [Alphaproteobacteria bacterium]|nr:phosphate ABC transporter permease PstA [Alphaproteobacteria bacterium]
MTDSFTQHSPHLANRHAAEIRFQWAGRVAIFLALAFLFVMIGSIFYKGTGAFWRTYVALDIDLSKDAIDPQDLAGASYGGLVKKALKAKFPDVKARRDRRKLYGLVSSDAAFALRKWAEENPAELGGVRKFWFVASDDVDVLRKGGIDVEGKESDRRVSDKELKWVATLAAEGRIEQRFNWAFFTSGDSREPELAGILSALVGSAWSLLVCFFLSFPVGIMAAIYLEEFSKKGWWSDLLEVNINNLAAVPSIVFGLLGLAIFLNTFGLPRSSPLVGGMVLALMTLPTIIIAARAALRAVPPSIREAALGIGASPLQSTFHHVLPLAMPGMLTGAIVGMARALGETAPLLMIGMVAFIADVPQSILEPATALPVQIFLWADSPERAFLEKASAAIIVLLFFLVVMNLIAIVLRRRMEQRF